jgi:predicted metal-dependent HD superfamily phosphohydrolase
MILQARWLSLCLELGLDGQLQWDLIIQSYRTPGRAYHNLNHIADCLSKLDSHAALAADRGALEFAIWYHDVVYDPRAADNEERSAAMARSFLAGNSIAQAVSRMILATKHGPPPEPGDPQLMCDIDLSILGRSREAYASYAQAIRAEYFWVSNKDYSLGRAEVLRGFLERETIFATPPFRDLYEEPARTNIAWELAALAARGSE